MNAPTPAKTPVSRAIAVGAVLAVVNGIGFGLGGWILINVHQTRVEMAEMRGQLSALEAISQKIDRHAEQEGHPVAVRQLEAAARVMLRVEEKIDDLRDRMARLETGSTAPTR